MGDWLQICLGASARATHRGKSIKNLIRHGHEGNALVRITLRNDGALSRLAPFEIVVSCLY